MSETPDRVIVREAVRSTVIQEDEDQVVIRQPVDQPVLVQTTVVERVVVEQVDSRVVVQEADLVEKVVVQEAPQRVKVNDFAVPGPPGPPGAGGTGASLTFSRVAFGDLSGHRVVAERVDDSVEYIGADTQADRDRAPWLTLGAALDDDLVELLPIGSVIEPSWSWTPGLPIYLSTSGLMTQVPPTTSVAEFSYPLAVALDATTIYFNPKLPIQLA